jgi:hypothetical protein
VYLHSLTTALIIEMCNQLSSRVNLHLEKKPRYILGKRMGGLRNWSGWLEKRTSETTGNGKRSNLKESFLIVHLNVYDIDKCIKQ